MVNYFENIEIFSGISVEDQVNLSDFCQLQHLQAGDILFEEWDMPQALYIIADGDIEVKKKVSGELKQVALLSAGDMLWEMAFYGDHSHRNATAIAQNDVTLIVMISFMLNQIIDNNPNLHTKLQDIVTQRVLKNKNI